MLKRLAKRTPRLRRKLNKLTLNGTPISDCVDWEEWHDLRTMLGNNIPLGSKEIKVSAGKDPLQVARIQLGCLVPDTRWIPFEWATPTQDDLGKYAHFQSPRLVTLEEEPQGWQSYMFDLVVLLAQTLPRHAREIPDLYYRDAYELYNKLLVDLASDVEQLDDVRFCNAYVVDPRFPGESMRPLFESSLDDNLKAVVDTLMQYKIECGVAQYEGPGISVAPWRTKSDRLSRYHSLVVEMLKKKPTPYGAVVFGTQLSYLCYGHALSLDLHTLGSAMQVLMTNRDYVNVAYEIARYTIIESKKEWCPGIFTMKPWGVVRTLETLNDLAGLLSDDEELVDAIARKARSIGQQHERRAAHRPEPTTVVL